MRMPWKDVVGALGVLRVLCPSPVPITISTHEKALKIAKDLGYEIYDALVPKRGGKAGPDFDLRHSFTEDEAPHLIAKLLYLVGIGRGSKAFRQSEKSFLFFFLRFEARSAGGRATQPPPPWGFYLGGLARPWQQRRS